MKNKKKKLNCWEYNKCEVYEKCPTYSETSVDGINDGKNGGRCCWVIPGTLCTKKKNDSSSSKYEICRICNFYLTVLLEQIRARNLKQNSKIEEILKNKDKKESI